MRQQPHSDRGFEAEREKLKRAPQRKARPGQLVWVTGCAQRGS
jgi:hypothetical protein